MLKTILCALAITAVGTFSATAATAKFDNHGSIVSETAKKSASERRAERRAERKTERRAKRRGRLFAECEYQCGGDGGHGGTPSEVPLPASALLLLGGLAGLGAMRRKKTT